MGPHRLGNLPEVQSRLSGFWKGQEALLGQAFARGTIHDSSLGLRGARCPRSSCTTSPKADRGNAKDSRPLPTLENAALWQKLNFVERTWLPPALSSSKSAHLADPVVPPSSCVARMGLGAGWWSSVSHAGLSLRMQRQARRGAVAGPVRTQRRQTGAGHALLLVELASSKNSGHSWSTCCMLGLPFALSCWRSHASSPAAKGFSIPP